MVIVKSLITFSLFLFGRATLLFAEIEITETFQSVYYRGESELLGNITMRVNDNDFVGVSPEEPIFIEILLGRGAVLSRTLVDQNAAVPTISQPIYLSLALTGEDETISLKAPGESVSIARWVAGEASFWIEVQSDSSTWLDFSGQLGPPRDDASVTFAFGLSARRSHERRASLASHRANLPFNTRDPTLPPGTDHFEKASSTVLCLDLSSGSLTPSGEDSILFYTPTAYGSEAEREPGIFSPIEPLEITITGNFQMGSGRKRECSVSPSFPLEVVVPLPESPGPVSVTNTLDLMLSCPLGGAYIDVVLTDGAVLTLSVGERESYGFGPEDVVTFVGEGVDPGVVRFQDPFEIEGQTYYKTAELTWMGGPRVLDGFQVRGEATIKAWADFTPKDLLLDWSLQLIDTLPEADETPFDGPDQFRGCRDGFIAGTGLWRIGSIGGRFASKKMVPHVTRATGGFTTEIIIANTYAYTQSVLLFGYRQDGDWVSTTEQKLEAGQTAQYAIEHLFGTNDIGYFTIAGSPVSITVVYRADRRETSPTHLRETTRTARLWRIYPGRPDVTWDGVALVNTGLVSTPVTMTLNDFNGMTLAETVLSEPLAPGAKILTLLTSGSHNTDHAYFEIIANEPLALIALRGNLNSDFLWENAAIPLDEP